MDLGTETFRLSRHGAEGYDQHQVDEFVAQIKEALRHRPPTMAPWEVRDMVFRVQRVHRGYDEHDVDDFLDRAEEALREAHGETLPDPHADVRAGHTHRLLIAAAVVVLVVVVVLLLVR